MKAPIVGLSFKKKMKDTPMRGKEKETGNSGTQIEATFTWNVTERLAVKSARAAKRDGKERVRSHTKMFFKKNWITVVIFPFCPVIM